MLNHELATLQEEMPYLAAIWHPMPVVQFWGRSASRQPPCAKDHAVFHWWRDCGWINKWNLLAHRIHKHNRWSLSPTIYTFTLCLIDEWSLSPTVLLLLYRMSASST